MAAVQIQPVKIHPTAIVEPGAELDEGVSVGAYSIIGPHVKLGRDSVIHPHVVLSGHTTLGARTTVFQFASVGAPPQDLKYKGEPTELVLGDGNTVRECVTLQAGTVQGNGKTVVGSGNLFMAYSHVAHDCVVGDGNIFANSATLAGHVTIENRVILGGLVAIHQFARIGDFAFIGGGAMVSKDVPPFAMVQGDRAKIVGVNVVGLRRAGFSTADVRAIREFYRRVLLQTGALEARLSELTPEVRENKEVARLLQFLNESKRGVCAPRSGGDDEIDLG
jgi:UDP-N-acetylglucosamine acyltransferase